MNQNAVLYLVVPCYNEQEVLPETSKQLNQKMTSLIESHKISPDSRIVFVNDGSKDTTWQIIQKLHAEDKLFQGVNLSRNRGHQNALLAGLMTVKEYCDITISLDADLQDDIDAIDGMVDKYYEGCEIVYGVRNARDTDTFFKKTTAEGYYKVMQMLGADIVFNHADYRLMSRKALDGLEQFQESNIFLRGIVPMIGYKTGKVFYARKERMAGESKYPLKKMLAFAWEGITSLSVRPIKMITGCGVFIFIAGIVMLIYSLIRHLMGATIAGWTSMMFSIWALGGLQLLSIGIIGEYIGKVYLETKSRPKFIVQDYLNDES
jgi:glycosyltransferase involved in cell wall biosynthesis